MGNIYTAESIKEMLTRSNAAVERALIVLYERQTTEEQVFEQTTVRNGVGFNAVDAEILTSFASQVQRKVGQHSDYLGRERKLGECLTPKQMELARKKVVRYAKQLTEVANTKAGEAAAQAEIAKLKAEGVISTGDNLEAEMNKMVAQAERREDEIVAYQKYLRDTEAAMKAASAVGETLSEIVADVEAASRPGGYESIKSRIAAWATS